MKNRLKELAEQAGIPKEIVVKESSTYLRDSDAVVRFAELIVKECCEVAHCHSHVSGLSLGDLLKKHFGVK
jgi:hypothetical protein